MKIYNKTLIIIALFLLVQIGASYAQMPHIVQGYFLNPDLSKPAVGEIKFQGYLSRAPFDTTVSAFCGTNGAWGLELVFAEKINNAKWVAGDTLVVVFQNVSSGSFGGARSILRFVTTAESPEDIGNVTLPVEMTTFAATARTNAIAEEVVLEWRTAGESNNFGFEVQRSQDGKNFNKIGFVPGSGSSNIDNHYSFIDMDVTIARYYYRLKQLDSDGTFTYSEIKEVIVNAPDRFELSQNFPNPFNPVTEIVFRVRQEVSVVLKVYDILGREVKTLINEKMNAGSHRISFDGKDLPSGMYLYAITMGNFHSVKKMVLIK